MSRTGKHQKHQKEEELRTFDARRRGELSLLEASEVDVLTAEPTQFGSVGEALLNLRGLPFWG